MASFDVTLVRIGNVTVEADSAEEAATIADALPESKICWGSFSVTDVQEEEG